ncbi:hypothetical protein B9Z19DRAFT_1130061 [Tuber borchii]|uniref:Uncharacterized protein n=1 Tax=Tuber borchii TaxID=42251 RepID=A0A2T6ZL12_TUBBO|nr:hypothetical protein B9Z19DRAFT_1130061 [Tuber borchii]
MAKNGCFMEEEEDIGELLTWGKWEQRRKENEKRIWKEYWRKERKGMAYFGNEGGRKCGHDGKRIESIFLFWMRVGHGRMRGTRYGNRHRKCECEGWEDRDHVLLFCLEWIEERVILLEMVEEEGGKGDDWVDMEWLLFSDEGSEGVKSFGRSTDWMKKRWKERIVWEKEAYEEKGVEWRNVFGESRKLSERTGDKRKRDLELGRLRMRKRRRLEKERKNGEKIEGRAVSPIASGTTLGAQEGRRRKVLGVISGNVGKGYRKL